MPTTDDPDGGVRVEPGISPREDERVGPAGPAEEPRNGVSEGQDSESGMSMHTDTKKMEDWLPGVLSMMAKTQRDLVSQKEHRQGDTGHHKKNLASVKIEEFSGEKGTSAYQYRSWKKSVEVTRRLHSLTDHELALLLFTQLKGQAKKRVDVMELTDLERPDILDVMWDILDRHYEQMHHERVDDAYNAWDSLHRRPGQSME